MFLLGTTGPLEAHFFPAQAHCPPKPQGPSGNPSSSMAGPVQAKYSPTPSHQVLPVHLDSLSMASLFKHTCCMAKLFQPAMATLSAHHPALPSLDIFHLEASRLAQHPSSWISQPHRTWIWFRDKSGEESCSMMALMSTHYKKVVNHIWPVQMTLPEEYCLIQMIPSDRSLSLPILPTQPPDFIPSKNSHKSIGRKWNINMSGFLWLDEEKLVLFLIKCLMVSALHYSDGSWVLEGFRQWLQLMWLHQPTIVGPSISRINVHQFGT